VWCVVKSFLFSAKIKKKFRSIFHTQFLRLAVVEDGAYLATQKKMDFPPMKERSGFVVLSDTL
jgi:hypothetical protein